MSDRSLNGYVAQPSGVSATFWFAGTTAVKVGQGFCHNWDYGTAATAEARRGRDIEVPTILNAPFFAGVAKSAYPANSDGQYIELWLPGSVCPVWTDQDTTVGVGRITCQAGAGASDAGTFTLTGFPGRGSAIPLQTVSGSSTAETTCMARLEEGEESGLVENITDYAGAEAEAKVFMVGGVSYFGGTTATGAKTFALADGTKVGQQKGFFCRTTLSSEGLTVTPASTGVQLDGSTTLATFLMETAQDAIIVKWSGLGTGATWSTESLYATAES